LIIFIYFLFLVSGAYRLPGQTNLPTSVKNTGAYSQSKAAINEDEMDRIGYCGLWAFTLDLKRSYYIPSIGGPTNKLRRERFPQWQQDVEDLLKDLDLSETASMDNMEFGEMRVIDFDKIVQLDRFAHKRIVVYTLHGRHLAWISVGKDWCFSPEERTTKDPNTHYLLLHSKHYYPMHNLTKMFPGNNARICYNCHRTCYTAVAFNNHVCESHQQYTCSICKKVFIRKDLYDLHISIKTTDTECQNCGKLSFHGPDCYHAHLTFNCNDEINIPVSNKCSNCLRRITKTNHIDGCPSGDLCHCCDVPLDTTGYRNHDCWFRLFQNETKPFELITYKDNGDYKWTSHWSYDFETTRAETIYQNDTVVPQAALDRHPWTGVPLALAENNPHNEPIYIHEVMAWETRLCRPDNSIENLRPFNIHEVFEHRLECAKTQYPDIEWFQPTNDYMDYRIRGKSILSFTHCVENVLVNQTLNWKPILWAHNGSKFDVKFILDHYVMTEKLEIGKKKFIYVWNQTGPVGHWKPTTKLVRKDVVEIAHIGSKILKLLARGAEYRDSYAHLTGSLRSLPKTLGFESSLKGEFPYRLLKRENWGKILPYPELAIYDIDALSIGRKEELSRWYEQNRTTNFDFDKELWKYLDSDVDVLKSALEKFHTLMIELQQKLPASKRISPLSYLTAPAYALGIYKNYFVLDERIAILSTKAAVYIRQSLRGGRTDKRSNIVALNPKMTG
jgi:hypothetical protein